jgi:hypothetical protein
MKNLILFLAFITLGTSESFAQTGWFQQSPLQTDIRLNGVNFTDANTGTIVGANGTILRTTDGGTTWVDQTSNSTAYLYGISFTDANFDSQGRNVTSAFKIQIFSDSVTIERRNATSGTYYSRLIDKASGQPFSIIGAGHFVVQ